jgi:hypothetical protein
LEILLVKLEINNWKIWKCVITNHDTSKYPMKISPGKLENTTKINWTKNITIPKAMEREKFLVVKSVLKSINILNQLLEILP